MDSIEGIKTLNALANRYHGQENEAATTEKRELPHDIHPQTTNM